MNKRLATMFLILLCFSLLGGLSESYSQVPQIQKRGNEADAPKAIQILNGKIAIEGGAGQVPDATVVLECEGTPRARTVTDREGNFSLNPNAQTLPNITAPLEHESASSGAVGSCVLYGDAPGYTSERLYVPKEPSMDQITEVGTIVLRPVVGPGASERSTVSVVSLAAPTNAKKAFEKGQRDARKKKWQAACDYFRQALKIYPSYAVAWLELGRAQVKVNTLQEAEQSFQQAAHQRDDRFTAIAANTELMGLASNQRDWVLLEGTTDHLVELSPDLSPKVWFFNSVAKFNLGNLPAAERSAIRGLNLDSRHSLPQLHYLYGLILAREKHYSEAIEHLRTYLRLTPKANDATAAQNLLSQLEELASQAHKSVAP